MVWCDRLGRRVDLDCSLTGEQLAAVAEYAHYRGDDRLLQLADGAAQGLLDSELVGEYLSLEGYEDLAEYVANWRPRAVA